MVVGFVTTYAISAYQVVGSNSADGEVYSIQHYVIKFVSVLRSVGGYLWVLPVSSTYKTDHHDIAEIVLKVALNTINNINTVFNFVPFFPLTSVVFIHPIPHENQVLLALPIFSGVRVARSLVCCF
jgi:hypothetical protein